MEILKEEREKLDASLNQNIKLADQLNAAINRINEIPKNVHITVFVFIINYIFKLINSLLLRSQFLLPLQFLLLLLWLPI